MISSCNHEKADAKRSWRLILPKPLSNSSDLSDKKRVLLSIPMLAFGAMVSVVSLFSGRIFNTHILAICHLGMHKRGDNRKVPDPLKN